MLMTTSTELAEKNKSPAEVGRAINDLKITKPERLGK